MDIITQNGDVIKVSWQNGGKICIEIDNSYREGWAELTLKEAITLTHELCVAMSQSHKAND